MRKIKKSKTYVGVEIIAVLAVMLGVKNFFDYISVNGAGSIGIWAGIFVVYKFFGIRKEKWTAYGAELPSGLRNWVRSILTALATVILVFLLMGLVLDPLLSSIGLVKPPTAADRFQFFLGNPSLFLMYLVVVVWFGAALGEELLMRGYLLNRLLDITGKSSLGWISAIVLHAIIFGSLHIYQGFAGVITTFFVAVIFAIIYVIAKKKLFPVILAHVLINTITLTAFYLNDGNIN